MNICLFIYKNIYVFLVIYCDHKVEERGMEKGIEKEVEKTKMDIATYMLLNGEDEEKVKKYTGINDDL